MKQLLFILFFSSTFYASVQAETEQDIDFSLNQSGIIQTVKVNVGDRVKKGQLLLQLNRHAIQAQIQADQARIKATEAIWQEANKEKKRNQALREQNLIAVHEYEISEQKQLLAQADYQQAKAQLVQHQQQKREHQIIAPFAGTVTAVKAHQGQAINTTCQQIPLITLVKD